MKKVRTILFCGAILTNTTSLVLADEQSTPMETDKIQREKIANDESTRIEEKQATEETIILKEPQLKSNINEKNL